MDQEHKEYTATELANKLNDAVNMLHEKSKSLARLVDDNKRLYDEWQEANEANQWKGSRIERLNLWAREELPEPFLYLKAKRPSLMSRIMKR